MRINVRTWAVNDEVVVLVVAELVTKPVKVLDKMPNSASDALPGKKRVRRLVLHAIHEAAIGAVVVCFHDVL